MYSLTSDDSSAFLPGFAGECFVYKISANSKSKSAFNFPDAIFGSVTYSSLFDPTQCFVHFSHRFPRFSLRSKKGSEAESGRDYEITLDNSRRGILQNS
jgi:hypothetical protein